MKALLKKILPWHVRHTLKWARYFHARRKPPFRDVLTQFKAEPANAPWRAKLWTESGRLHAEKARRHFLGESGTSIPDNPQPSKMLLPFLAAALPHYGSAPIRILDFGGAGGADFAHLLAALGNDPGLDVRYHVVDMPESCEAGRLVWRDEPRIAFSPELPAAGERFDIVYADGAVHMVEDTAALIAALAGYRPAFLLFCKTSMHEGPPFARRQVNMGPEMENAQWVLGFREFRDMLAENGYDLAFRGYGEDSYNVDNYSAPYRAGRTVNLLFRRRNDSR